MTDLFDTPRDTEPVANAFEVNPHLEIDSATRRIALLLQLDVTDVNNSGILEKLNSDGFTQKAEFHVTAVDIKQGSVAAAVFDNLSKSDQAAAIDILQKAEASLWQIRPRDEFYLVEKRYEEEENPRISVIQLVDCPGLDSLYAKLNLLTSDGIRFEAPPAHITLATQGSTRGIGISTLHELHTLGTPLAISDQA